MKDRGEDRRMLEDLLDLYSHLIMTVDGLWFLGIERRDGIGKAIEIDEEVWREYARLESRRLMRLLGMEGVSGPEDVARLVEMSPMWRAMGARCEVEAGRCVVSVHDCRPQKARVKKGLGEFPCRSVGVAYFDELGPSLDPRIRYRCVFCPPGEHPEDVWCRWELWFQEP